MFLTTTQVAEKLQITPERVKRLAETGALPHLPLHDPDSKRKYYRFDEQAVYAYRRSLKHVAAPQAPATTSVRVEAPVPDARKVPVPDGFVPLTAAAERIGIKRQALYDAIKYHPERFDVQKIGKLMFVSEVSVERERMRRSTPVPAPAAAAPAVNNSGNHAEPPTTTVPVIRILSKLEHHEQMQVAANLRIHELSTKIDRLSISQAAIAAEVRALAVKLEEALAVWR